MIDIVRPITLCPVTQLADRPDEWSDLVSSLALGTFGTLPSPYTLPNDWWPLSSEFIGDQGLPDQLDDATSQSSNNSFVILESSDEHQVWNIVIENKLYQYFPAVKTTRNWIDAVLLSLLGKLGLLKNAKAEKSVWNVNYGELQEAVYLDSGAQGLVYLAKLNNEAVAVKRLRSKCAIADFAHLRKLSHPNIVAFKGACVSPTSHSCIVMEYVPFGQLCQYLANTESLTPSLLAEWSHQIASGMAYLHDCSIIHRDLKSPNVLLSYGKLLKICDFDTSRQMDAEQNRRQMSLAGTVSWMAPEMIRNEQCSEKIDVWSYGVILWELTTLEMPYRHFEPIAIMFGVGNGTLQLHLPQFTSTTTALGDLMKKCWRTDPKERPSFEDILVHIDSISLQFRDLDSAEFQQLQPKWKSEVQAAQSRIRSHSSSSRLTSTPISTATIAISAKSISLSDCWDVFIDEKSGRADSCADGPSITSSDGVRKRKQPEDEEERDNSEQGEASEKSPRKQLKASPVDAESQCQSPPQPIEPDINLLKYLYAFIVRRKK